MAMASACRSACCASTRSPVLTECLSPKIAQAWGKCDSAWMVGGGYCKQTCGRCVGGDQRAQLKKANAPVTLEKVTAGGSAPADVKTMSGAKVFVVSSSD